MTSWQGEYVNALKERDSRHTLDYNLIDAYTRLADRTAALEAEKSSRTSSSIAKQDVALGLTYGQRDSEQGMSDLAEALRSNGQLQYRLKVSEEEMEKLKQRNHSDSKLVRDLASERVVLVTKVKDRDEELKGKAKLLEDVQNEMVSLNLQLNMAEQRSKKLGEENEQLIRRWMTRMGQEADDMNNASRFS